MTNFNLADPETTILDRLHLDDLRLPRYDVTAGSPATSNAVYAAFFKALFKLAGSTLTALNAAYDAFKPVLQATYAANPFDTFAGKFGFLDATPGTTAQVRFAQYYYDFFDDLPKAYDEFRWKGVDLLCACCPRKDCFRARCWVWCGDGCEPIFIVITFSRHCGSNCEIAPRNSSAIRRMVTMIGTFQTPKLPLRHESHRPIFRSGCAEPSGRCAAFRQASLTTISRTVLCHCFNCGMSKTPGTERTVSQLPLRRIHSQRRFRQRFVAI
jgi:hypothetical protein